jgi:hypothetical protein
VHHVTSGLQKVKVEVEFHRQGDLDLSQDVCCLHNNVEQDNTFLARGVRGLACQYLKQVFDLCKANNGFRIFCFCLSATLICVHDSLLQLGNTGWDVIKFGINIVLLKVNTSGNLTLRQYKHYGRL